MGKICECGKCVEVLAGLGGFKGGVYSSLELLATYWMVEGFLQFGAFSYWPELCLIRVEGFH